MRIFIAGENIGLGRIFRNTINDGVCDLGVPKHILFYYVLTNIYIWLTWEHFLRKELCEADCFAIDQASCHQSHNHPFLTGFGHADAGGILFSKLVRKTLLLLILCHSSFTEVMENNVQQWLGTRVAKGHILNVPLLTLVRFPTLHLWKGWKTMFNKV